MKTIFTVCMVAALLAGCSGNDAYNQGVDTANLLQDTLPAHNPPVEVSPDSTPADRTRVHPENMNR